ncbi:AAA family ATPase [Actinomycetospora endophytica]|uniref:AAA family ATPase n=1 Tax=Actinomycetospora endophytica TaxID=2291215 RepID=A0ABS8P133_9PSEU|nr:BTAD domain-containing putative transcriptional regulator [Actinomycetospora endophytica]MCD2191955.1 AAA family ATPase [Actinomycetospora endophytica]
MGSADSGSVRFLDLGALMVEVDGHLRTPGGRRPAAALAVLLIHANRPVSVDTLSDAIWDDGRPRAVSTLESHLWRLRQVLEPGREPGEPWSLLVTDPGGYRLSVAVEQVDSSRFAALVEEAGSLLGRGQPDRALQRCESARALWRGRPLAPVADQPWAAPTVARLEELRAQLAERHVDALLDLGDPQRALLELEPALGEHPLREHLWARRMLAAFRAGRVDDALATYHRARSLLVAELGTEPTDELRDLHRRMLADDPSLRSVTAAGPTNRSAPELDLPRWSSRLVGRDRELERLTSLVGRSSLVTVHGPAGVGKTRLAVEAAHRVADAFADGVWFVDLVGARDGDQVLDAITTALSLAAPATGSPSDALHAFLRDRRGLLLLDDCEHVLTAVASLVEPLVRDAPGLGLVVTSRERLDLEDETAMELPPLVVPDEDDAGGSALDLFLDRWEAVTGPTDPDDLDEARRVCRAVEGVPLALELAAARAATFTLAEIAEQTEQDPGTLSALGRHRHGARPGVYAAVERSHRLLDDDARLLHRRLAVLPGPFTVAAAAAAAGIAPVVAADLLADLTHRSMVVARGPAGPGRPSRFSQLTIVRAHAARALDDAGEKAAAQDRRDAWIERLATEGRPRLGTPEELARSRALADDAAALRSALQHTLIEDPSPRGPEIIAGLGALFWFQHDATLEGTRWVEIAHTLCATDPDDVAPVTALRVSIGSATAQAFAGRLDLAAPLCDGALRDVARVRLDPDQELLSGDALVVLSTSLGFAGEPERAAVALGAAADIVRRTSDPTLTLVHRVRTRMAELGRSAPGEVLAALAEVYREASSVDNWFGAWLASAIAHMAALAIEDAHTALQWSDACLAVVDRTGRRQAPLQLELRANTLAQLGRYPEALRVYGAAMAQNDRAGLPWPTAVGTDVLLERTRAAVPSHSAERIGRGVARLTVADFRTPAVADGRWERPEHA